MLKRMFHRIASALVFTGSIEAALQGTRVAPRTRAFRIVSPLSVNPGDAGEREKMPDSSP